MIDGHIMLPNLSSIKGSLIIKMCKHDTFLSWPCKKSNTDFQMNWYADFSTNKMFLNKTI